ncbi:MAG: hypothetical protein P4L67_00875 [Candidatus Pacebacteria bacterium]|nr:hypothetical protein [Candidatus Paceibacterota bacterium]
MPKIDKKTKKVGKLLLKRKVLQRLREALPEGNTTFHYADCGGRIEHTPGETKMAGRYEGILTAIRLVEKM